MWPSFIKALLVYGIVLGIEQIALSRYYQKRDRVISTRWLLTGASTIVIGGLGLWLVSTGYAKAWGVPELVVLSGLLLLCWVGIEIYITVRVERKPWTYFFDKLAQPRQATLAPARHQPAETMPGVKNATSRAAEVAMTGLVMGLFALQAAVVSVVVSPELLAIKWWIVAIVIGVAFGVLVGLYATMTNRVTP